MYHVKQAAYKFWSGYFWLYQLQNVTLGWRRRHCHVGFCPWCFVSQCCMFTHLHMMRPSIPAGLVLSWNLLGNVPQVKKFIQTFPQSCKNNIEITKVIVSSLSFLFLCVFSTAVQMVPDVQISEQVGHIHRIPMKFPWNSHPISPSITMKSHWNVPLNPRNICLPH